MYTILLYYTYTRIDDPEALKKAQKKLCDRLGLKGRVIIAEEGINGTLGGTAEAVEEYMQETMKVPGLEGIEWKQSQHETIGFPRMRVVVRPEIVTLGLDDDVDPTRESADYIEPEELLALYENDEEFYIIDGRNEYEARIGRFRDSIIFDVEAFRDIPEKVEELDDLRDKEVITFCTGGIRCEKLSAYFKRQGFKKVRQLHGGIHNYAEKTGGKYFDGTLYVFDERVHMPVNSVDPTVISECHHCDMPVARYRNCANPLCNKQIIVCESCEEAFNRCCSTECIAALPDTKPPVENQPGQGYD